SGATPGPPKRMSQWGALPTINVAFEKPGIMRGLLERDAEFDGAEADDRARRHRRPKAGRQAIAVDHGAVVAVVVTHVELSAFELEAGVHAGNARLVQRDHALGGVAAGSHFLAGQDGVIAAGAGENGAGGDAAAVRIGRS